MCKPKHVNLSRYHRNTKKANTKNVSFLKKFNVQTFLSVFRQEKNGLKNYFQFVISLFVRTCVYLHSLLIMNSDIGNGNAKDQNQFSSMAVGKKAKRYTADTFDYTEIERMLPENFDDLYHTLPLTEDTTCGLWIFKGDLLQK